MTERVSLASDGSEANSGAGAWVGTGSVSSDGRFVAFVSSSTNLVPNDTNGDIDIFVRDRLAGTTERVSVASDGTQAIGDSFDPDISADGRYVAFRSQATNLVPGDTNGVDDVFVHDRQTGMTKRVSVSSSGVQADNRSQHPSVSGDGRLIAFTSTATNLVSPLPGGEAQVYLHDLDTGQTSIESTSSAGVPAATFGNLPAMSGDGNSLMFTSPDQLVPSDPNAFEDVYVKDLLTGSVERVSIGDGGEEPNGVSGSRGLDISDDGQKVLFSSQASNLVPGDTENRQDLFVRDRLAAGTDRVSVSSAGDGGNLHTGSGSLSGNGRYVVFHTDSTNVVANDTNNRSDIFVHDLETGQTEIVSVSSDGTQGSGGDSQIFSNLSAISSDGQVVAFYSAASNLVANDTNGRSDIFVSTRADLAQLPVAHFDIDCDGVVGSDTQPVTVLYSAAGKVSCTFTDTHIDGDFLIASREWKVDGVVEATLPQLTTDLGVGVHTIEYAITDTTGESDTAIGTVTVMTPPGEADLALSVVDEPDSVVEGANFRYRFTITNNGSGTATNVTLITHLRYAVIAPDVSAINPGGGSEPCSYDDPWELGPRLICLFGDLAPGESFPFGFAVGTRSPGLIGFGAGVFTDAPDPDSTNDQVSLVTTVLRDRDRDGKPDEDDNCTTIWNPDQSNVDGDLFGDLCDSDADGDGIQNPLDGTYDPITGFVSQELVESSRFTNEDLGGSTFGRIGYERFVQLHVLDGGSYEGYFWTPFGWKYRESSVAVEVVAAGPPINGFGFLQLCDSFRLLRLEVGRKAYVACGSLEIDVITGPVFLDLGATQVELATGVAATIVETAPGVYTIANSPTSTGLIRIGALIVEPGEAPTLAFPVAADSIDTAIETLDDLISANPKSDLADKLEDIVAKLETASEELAKDPVDRQAATGAIEGAVADLEAAIKDSLFVDDPDTGIELAELTVYLARQIAVEAIADVQGGDPDKLAEAQDYLNDGDALRAISEYKDAAAAYKDAVSKANGA